MLGICWLGVVISDVAYVFTVPLCEFSTSLPYIWHVAYLAGKFIYLTSIVVWYFFWVLGFDTLLYCVCALESDVNVCVFKEIGKLSDFWAVVCKCCPFFFCFYLLLFLCELFAVFLFLVLLCVHSGSYCSALRFALFPILSVVFLLLVLVTAFCWCDSSRPEFCVRSSGWIRSSWCCLSL